MLVLVLQEADAKTELNRQMFSQGEKNREGAGKSLQTRFKSDGEPRREKGKTEQKHLGQQGCQGRPGAVRFLGLPAMHLPLYPFPSQPLTDCSDCKWPGHYHKCGNGFQSVPASQFALHSWEYAWLMTMAMRPRVWQSRGTKLDCFKNCVTSVIC